MVSIFPHEIEGAARIVANPEDRIIRDTTGDGVGNSMGNVADGIARVGEAPGTDDADSRYYLPFGTLSAEEIQLIRTAPHDLGAITLNISLGAKSAVEQVSSGGDLVDLRVDLFGFTDRMNPTAAVPDYHNPNVILLHPSAVTPATPNTWLSFDVTSFAKQEIEAGNSVLAFRLQINPPDALPNTDGQPNRYLFHTADHSTNKPFLEIRPAPPVPVFIGTEGFDGNDYPDSVLLGRNAILFPFDGAWAGSSASPAQLAEPGLDYPGYTTLPDGSGFAAGNRRLSVQANSNFSRRLLTGNNGPLRNFVTSERIVGTSHSGDSLYLAFLMRMTSEGDTPPIGSFSIYKDGSKAEDRVFRIACLEDRVEAAAGGADPAFLGPRNADTNLFVLRFDFSPGDETSQVWMNPDLEGISPPDAVFEGPVSFDRLGITFFRPVGASGELALDELRWGTSWEGVVQAAHAADRPGPMPAPPEEEHKMEGYPTSPRGDGLYPAAFHPMFDRFGQYRHMDWPDKIHDVADLLGRTDDELEELAILQPTGRSRFGGWSHGPRLYGTGYFRTAPHGGKWWLVDPDGYLFFSSGVTTVGGVIRTDPGALASQKTGVTGREHFFADLPMASEPATSLGLYADETATVTSGHYQGTRPRAINFFASNALLQFPGVTGVHDLRTVTEDLAMLRLRSWGFNTVAGWSEPGLVSHPDRIPHTRVLFPTLPPAIPGSAFPDFFRPEYAENVRRQLEEEIGSTLGDPWNIGYFIHNEPDWAKSNVEDIDIALATLQSPRQSLDRYAKVALVELMQTRYPSVFELSDAWGADYLTWEEMLDRTDVSFDTAAASQDLTAFAIAYAEEYFRTNRDAMREVAPWHLYLGCRFTSGVIVRPEMSRAAMRFCDVYSINRYALEAGVFEGMEADLPIMLTEYATWSTETGLFGRAQGPQREDRPATFRGQLRSAIEHPRYVGAHWFQYYDFPASGRLNRANNNSNYGLVQVTNTPYRAMVEVARDLNYRMYEKRAEAAAAAPSADAHVQEGGQADVNFGLDTRFFAGPSPAGERRHAFLRFHTADWSDPVDRAILLLHPVDVSGEPLHWLSVLTDDSWEETALTWNNRPMEEGRPIASWVPVEGHPVEIDVTKVFNASLASGRQLSLMVSQDGGPGYAAYGSREGGEWSRPELRVVAGPSDLATWRRQYFPDGSALGRDETDSSGDGIPNLMKYAFGLNPVIPSLEGLPQMSRREDGRLSLAFYRARGDIVYSVETSSDLALWETYMVDPGETGRKVTVLYEPGTADNARFFRLKVSPRE